MTEETTPQTAEASGPVRPELSAQHLAALVVMENAPHDIMLPFVARYSNCAERFSYEYGTIRSLLSWTVAVAKFGSFFVELKPASFNAKAVYDAYNQWTALRVFQGRMGAPTTVPWMEKDSPTMSFQETERKIIARMFEVLTTTVKDAIPILEKQRAFDEGQHASAMHGTVRPAPMAAPPAVEPAAAPQASPDAPPLPFTPPGPAEPPPAVEEPPPPAAAAPPPQQPPPAPAADPGDLF